MHLLWISVGLLVLSIIALFVMLGCWTYTDAKIRSDKPELWTLIVLLVPNFIGLIIYLLLGRTKNSDEQQTVRNKFFVPLIVFAILALLSFLATMTASMLLPALLYNH